MKIGSAIILFSLVTLSASVTYGYELATHGRLTEQAFLKSSLLQDAQLLQSLGLDPNSNNPFGSVYYDITDSQIKERVANDFEKNEKRMSDPAEALTIKGWLMRGAIREDDVPFSPLITDDPVNDFRVRHHFYDPVYNRPLTRGVALGQKAPDWSLGTVDFLANPPSPNNNRDTGNHYTILDAREAMYRALTLKAKDPFSGSYTDIQSSGTLTTKEAVRNAYWATTFRALGDVVHLVEDMAQPQHTRNDPHAGRKYDGSSGFLGHKSVYESYIEARAIGGTFTTVGGANPSTVTVTAAPLDYGNFPIPVFTDYRSFFTTRQSGGGDNVLTRQGLADYSNRSFFSAGKNFDNTEYPYPIGFISGNTQDWTTDWEGKTLANGAKVKLLLGNLPDVSSPLPLTTYGLFDQFLQQSGQRGFTLTKPNYDAMADQLIPRAVAYSAGLINYFFRGRIEADDAGYTDTGISLRVKNAIDTTKNPQYKSENLSTGGKLVVAYDYLPAGITDNSRRVFGSSTPVTLTEDIKPGRSSPGLYSFTIPEIPETAVDVRFRLVYRGRLGAEEDAVAAATFEPLSGFLVVAPDGSGNRLVYRAWGKWRSSTKPDLKVGAVDWKGWYDATGRPTKVLSWKGPRSRYFPDLFLDDPRWDSVIYEGGELLAYAPSGVLGAAVQRDANGDEWLVAIVSGVGADVAYRRPYKRGGSDVLYHPVSAPDGWQELGRIPRGDVNVSENFTPWFFNGAGTEAQTVRLRLEFPGGVKTVVPVRYKIRITGATAQPPETFRPTGIRYQKQCRFQLAPPFDCESREAYVDESAAFQGSVIVAVDYLDNQEVFMEISDDRLDVYNRSIAASESVEEHPVYVPPLFPSGGNFHTTNRWCRGSGTKKFDKANSGARVVTVGSQRLVLDGSDGSNVTRAEANYLLCLGAWCGFEQPYPGYASAGQRTDGILTVQKGSVTFVDLRYSFMVVGRKVRSHATSGSGAASSSLNFTYTETTTTTEEKEFTRKIESTLGNWTLVTAPSTTSNVQQSTTVFGRPVSVSPDPGCANSETVSYPNPEQFLTRSLGSWLVDANHEVLISQSYQDENGVSRLFNFLTGGDLVQLMPPTPPQPYYGAFVVR